MKFNVKEKEESLHKVEVKAGLEEDTTQYEEKATKKKTFLFWGKKKKKEEADGYVSLDQEMATVTKVRKVRRKKNKKYHEKNNRGVTATWLGWNSRAIFCAL
ncbi:hypothetical protein [Listeria riparia]|uniref:Uncharacterized protein n=1 Tax=Listeria riparia FSL S10-1204 TaxID=1265816 RepID=W7D4Z0_9LIST|nr:hypothetical protein [Listeria riparia]EUJ42911.1 hypothetical protein PRIP_14687 [Listeria riparia FSL S10-1204]